MADAKGKKKVMGQSRPDEAWLAKLTESVLDPDLEIIDPHHHLWIRAGDRYLMPEFVDDLSSGHNIISTVFAECHSMYRASGPEQLRSLGETEFVAGCAAMADSGVFGDTRICEGIVGNVDLSLGDAVEDLFQQHLQTSGGRFRGVRYTTAWDKHKEIPNPAPRAHMLAEPAVRSAAAVMAELNLTLDCWVFHPQLEDILSLAQALPDLTIVLNHTGVPILGGPYRDRRDEVVQAWKQGIRNLSTMDNVFIKLGAVPIRRPGDGIDRSLPPDSEEIAASWSPWMVECIEAFGSHRCMFESNFPVQKLFASYTSTWNAFKRIAHTASADEKRNLFSDAARRAYRLS